MSKAPLKYKGSLLGRFINRGENVYFETNNGKYSQLVILMRRESTAKKMAEDLNSRFSRIY